jgi:hypothetical protein
MREENSLMRSHSYLISDVLLILHQKPKNLKPLLLLGK